MGAKYPEQTQYEEYADLVLLANGKPFTVGGTRRFIQILETTDATDSTEFSLDDGQSWSRLRKGICPFFVATEGLKLRNPTVADKTVTIATGMAGFEDRRLVINPLAGTIPVDLFADTGNFLKRGPLNLGVEVEIANPALASFLSTPSAAVPGFAIRPGTGASDLFFPIVAATIPNGCRVNAAGLQRIGVINSGYASIGSTVPASGLLNPFMFLNAGPQTVLLPSKFDVPAGHQIYVHSNMPNTDSFGWFINVTKF